MADGFSDDVTSLAIETGIAADPGPCTKSEFERAQDQAKAETMLLGIYWYLYYDENVPRVLNQSWPTVWRVFRRLTERNPIDVEGAAMRKGLLDTGYTVKPDGVVGHAGLKQAAIDRLVEVGLLSGDPDNLEIRQGEKKLIERAAKVVARNIIRKTSVFLPDQSGTLNETNGEATMKSPPKETLDRELAELIDGANSQAIRPTKHFNDKLDRETLIGYLKVAQEDQKFSSQRAMAAHLGIDPKHLRKAYTGRVSVETMQSWLEQLGYKVRASLFEPGDDADVRLWLTNG